MYDEFLALDARPNRRAAAAETGRGAKPRTHRNSLGTNRRKFRPGRKPGAECPELRPCSGNDPAGNDNSDTGDGSPNSRHGGSCAGNGDPGHNS